MGSTRDEEDSRIDCDCLAVDRESTNSTSRRQLKSSEENTYKEPSSAVKKREQKMFESGETLPFAKNEERKKQNSQKSTIRFIICGFLILFILLTSVRETAAAQTQESNDETIKQKNVKLPDRRLKKREVDTQKETMLNEEIRKLKNNASILSETINEQEKIISEKEAAIQRHVADLTQLKSNASILMDTISSQKTIISEKEATIDRHVADIGEARNNASTLRQQVDELKAAVPSRDVDINRLKNKINELAPEHTSVMLLGGWHYDNTNSITIYDSMEKSWKNSKLTLPSTLRGYGAALLNNEIYIFGGDEGIAIEPLKSLYKLEAGNIWERMADMNEKRSFIWQSSVVFNSEIWVIGGWDGTNFLKSVEKYNPKTNNWAKMPKLHESRYNAAATVVDGKIYVSGGREAKNSVEVYDPEKEKWEIFTPSMPYGVESHILIGNHSHLITIGGDLSFIEPTNRVWKIDVLDPKREWKEMPSLQQKRRYSGAAIITDGLMVFGGSTNVSTRLDSVEIFDGVEWKNKAPLPEIRNAFAYIPLIRAQERLFLERFCQNS